MLDDEDNVTTDAATMTDDMTETLAETTDDSAEDLWGDALAEQAAEDGPSDGNDALEEEFEQLEDQQFDEEAFSGNTLFDNFDSIKGIPVALHVKLGGTKITVKRLLELTKGSVVDLDRACGEPLDILAGNILVAQGEIVAVDDQHGIRITKVFTD